MTGWNAESAMEYAGNMVRHEISYLKKEIDLLRVALSGRDKVKALGKAAAFTEAADKLCTEHVCEDDLIEWLRAQAAIQADIAKQVAK